MASFKHRSRDEIPSAISVAQLSPLRSEYKRPINSANWCATFSPNASYFAWSSGDSLVTLIPWNYCKSTLFSYSSASSPSKSGFKISVEKPDEVRHYFGCKALSIRTRYLVRSLAFCSVNSSCADWSSQTYWIRRSVSKDLFLATGHNTGHIRIWDVLTGKLLLELLDHCDFVTYLSFCPNGSMLLVSASYDGTMKVWDLIDDGNLLRTLKVNGKAFFSCCWSPDSTTMVSVGGSKLAYVWDLASCTLKLHLKGHQHDVIACSFSPDSCLIATASWDTRVILWDAYTGRLLKCFCHQHPLPSPIYACGVSGTFVRGVSFSPDGSHIATVADDGFLRFWDIFCDEDPECVAAVSEALCCSYSPSGSILAVGCRDGSVSFWCSSSATVKPLLFLARIAVRRAFAAETIDELGLPNRLLSYLRYEEL